jgi:hypothetical protein
MGDRGNSRGWALVLAVLTSSSLAAVALLLGLEAMSWIAAGIAVVLGVIALFSGTTGTDGQRVARFRPPASWAQKAVLAGSVIIVAGAVAFRGIVGPIGAGAEACPMPSDPTTRATITSTSSATHPDLKIKSMVYSLTYNGTDFMYLETTGQIAGRTPNDQLLYPFGSADPKTRDIYGNAGSERFFWGRDELIEPDQNGCWSKPQRKFGGYPGARGLTFYYHLGLVPRAQLSCLDALVSTKRVKDDGMEAADLARCGVTLLGYGHIPTDPP